MSAYDVVANVEKAEQAGGINAAYDQFKVEVDTINRNFAPEEREKQLASMTSQLKDAGLLPELSLKWAQDHRFDIKQEGQFSRADLTNFKKGNDALSQAMADALLGQYDELRKKHGDFGLFPHGLDLTKDWFGYEAISKNDLNNAVDELQKQHDDGVKDHEYGMSAGRLARQLESEEGGDALFKKVAGCDGESDSISYADLHSALMADKYAGGAMFTDEERNIVQTLRKDWNEPYVRKLVDENGHISAETLRASKDMLAAAEAAAGAETDNKDATGFMGDIISGVVNTAKDLADSIQPKQQVEVQPGDGFDRIARRVLMQNGMQPSESQVIAYAKEIAELNNMNRESTVLMTSDKLWLPKIAS